MLTTPSMIGNIKPFPPNKEYTFKFDYSSGAQATKNRLEIQRVSDNTVVYNIEKNSFSLNHTIPANTLTAGIFYKVRVKVSSVSGEQSNFSEWNFFYVFSEPLISITNIDYDNQNRVYSQTVEFEAEYSQTENEPLSSYRFIFYDSNKQILNSYPEKFDVSEIVEIPPSPIKKYRMSQEIAGLKNNELYYIELKTISSHLQEASTGLILVRPFYIAPSIRSAITLENKSEQGAIKVTANIVQIFGTLYNASGLPIDKNSVEYVDGEKLDMNRLDYERLVYLDGFNTDTSEFVLKLWCENVPEEFDKEILQIKTSNGYLKFYFYENRIHCFKHVNRVRYNSYYVSNALDFSLNSKFMLYAKSVNSMIHLEIVPL